jgi:hypothetical protein
VPTVVAGVTTGHEVRESRNKGEGAQVITMSGGEGCVMQATETVLSVIREPITRKVITGEPVMGKLIRRVREGADGKGPVLRAPRRRPTSLCEGRGLRCPRLLGVVVSDGKKRRALSSLKGL